MTAQYSDCARVHANAPFIGTCDGDYLCLSLSLSPYHGTSVMASVNYRRRAGNLIDRDKRSNCREGRARPVAIFFTAPKCEINL